MIFNDIYCVGVHPFEVACSVGFMKCESTNEHCPQSISYSYYMIGGMSVQASLACYHWCKCCKHKFIT